MVYSQAGLNPLRVDLTYDARDLLATVSRAPNLTGASPTSASAYGYDAVGRLTSWQNTIHQDVSLETYTYDRAGRLTGQRTQLLQPASTIVRSFGYDNADQLTSETVTQGGTTTTNQSYDAAGNRTNPGYQTGSANELASDGHWVFTYDAEGNLVRKVQSATNESWTYDYDLANRLVAAKHWSGTDPGTGTLLQETDFTYDALGNRVSKAVWMPSTGWVTTHFSYDQGEVWADLTGANALQTRYLHGPTVDALFARQDASGSSAWYLTDRLGSVRDIESASSGQLLDHLDYDAWGNATETAPSYGERHAWTGRERDRDTGLQYHHARTYDPTLGRWTSQDPAGFSAGDANLYRYVGNGPTGATDPSGLRAHPEGPEPLPPLPATQLQAPSPGPGIDLPEEAQFQTLPGDALAPENTIVTQPGDGDLLGASDGPRVRLTGVPGEPPGGGKRLLDRPTAKELKRLLQELNLPAGELRQRFWREKLNERRAQQGLPPLEAADAIDPNQGWMEAGEEAVILQLLKDFPKDGAQLLRRARLAGFRGLQSDGNHKWWETWAVDALERTITLAETKRWFFLERPMTVKEASKALHEALDSFVSKNAISTWLEGAGRLLTHDVEAGFRAAGLTEDLAGYEALVEEFEAEIALASNNAWHQAKEVAKQYMYDRLGGVAAGAVLLRLWKLRPYEEFASFRAFKRAMGSAGEGKVWHHIVEQRASNIARFGAEAIHNTHNVLPISREANQAIADYYSSIRRFTGGKTVREWLRAQSFAEQDAFGRKILNAVLDKKPLPP